MQEGNLDIVKFLFDRGANIESQNAYNEKPLHLAIKAGRLKIVKLLLDRGANINATDMEGQTPLDLAIQKGYEDIVEVLKEKQLDLDKELLTSAEKGDLEKVRESIRRGANVNIQDRQGWTSLFWAIQKNNFNIIELLLDKSADIKVKDNEGWTPLHWAVSLGSLDIVEHLVERGADVNASTADGRTPLDIARDKGYNNIVNYLEGELNKEREKPVQRKRRHHHGDHARHHMSRKPLAIDSSNQPEIATSSGIRPSSWINDCISWVKSSVGRLLSSKSEGTASSVSQVDGQFAKASISNSSFTGTTLPSDGTDKRQENGGFFRDNVDYVNANLKRMCERQAPVKFKPKGRNTILEMGDHYLSQVDFNGTITLFDLLIRRFTGQKYISKVDQSISPLEAQGYALNITNRFEKVLNKTAIKSGISVTNLNFDPVVVQSAIIGKIINGKFSEIEKTLYSIAKEACPEFKQTDKFLDHLRSNLKEEKETVMLQQKVEKPSKPQLWIRK